MTDHETPKNQWTQDSLFPGEDVVSLEKAQIERDATPASEALQQASEDRRRTEELEAEDDRRDRRGDNSFDDGYWRGPSNAPRLPSKKRQSVRRRAVHLRHDGSSESDEFHTMTGGYLSRSPEERAEQKEINERGKPIALTALNAALSSQTPPEPTPEEKAAALQEALEKQHAEVNASWDAIEAAINKKNTP